MSTANRSLQKSIVFCSFIVVVMLMAMQSATAVVELETLSTDLLQKRYEGLIAELRCPKCQNQNLAGSDSIIAQDLRREVRVMLEAGRSDQEIRNFLVTRYGNFVLYNPPMSGVTLWVWIIPVVILVIGLVVAVFAVRSASRAADATNVIDEDRIDNDRGEMD